MSDIKLDKHSLRKLKKSLPYGAITRIARKVNCSRTNVNNVLNGKYYNEQVILASIKEAEYHMKKKAFLSKIIDRLYKE